MDSDRDQVSYYPIRKSGPEEAPCICRPATGTTNNLQTWSLHACVNCDTVVRLISGAHGETALLHTILRFNSEVQPTPKALFLSLQVSASRRQACDTPCGITSLGLPNALFLGYRRTSRLSQRQEVHIPLERTAVTGQGQSPAR